MTDTHCHLLAGLDDGPRTPDDAVAMCRIMAGEGTHLVTALAHQNDEYPLNTPERIREAADRLRSDLQAAGVEVEAVTSAEVMVGPGTLEAFGRGELVTLGDTGKYILLEMPHGLTVNLAWMVEQFCERGCRPVLAHAERSQELLHVPGEVEKLIAAGCVIQVSSAGMMKTNRDDTAALRAWFERGIVHVMGSDGHSQRRRPPHMKAAVERACGWVGAEVVDRIAMQQGAAVLRGQPLRLPPPEPPRKRWFGWW